MVRALRLLGTVLALSCLGYLVVQHLPNLPPLDLLSPILWAASLFSVLFYILSQLTAAEAWRAILSMCGVHIAPALARSQLMLAQIGKYIPGNVAHLFGRIAIGRRDGVKGGILAAGMVLEVGITLGVGLSVAGILLVIMPDAIPDMTARFPELSNRFLAVGIAGVIALGVGAGTFLMRARLKSLETPRPQLKGLLRPLLFHMWSFGAHGVSLLAASWAIAPETVPDILTCTLIFAFAWSAGFLMPGAPAGIGVRDSIIVLGLALSVGQGPALAIALLHRAITVVGDVATFGIGWGMRSRLAMPHTPRNRPEPAAIVAD